MRWDCPLTSSQQDTCTHLLSLTHTYFEAGWAIYTVTNSGVNTNSLCMGLGMHIDSGLQSSICSSIEMTHSYLPSVILPIFLALIRKRKKPC